MVNDDVKIARIKKLLLMPIICDKSIDHVYRIDNTIYSGQHYCRMPDPDMSDIAVWYYETLYKEVFNGSRMLNDKNELANPCFAGDTINTYKHVAYIASKEIKVEKVEKWYIEYHCLANFWILPMEVGRTVKSGLSKMDRYEYIDGFVKKYNEQYAEYESQYGGYTNYFTKDDFINKHFLNTDIGFGECNNNSNSIIEKMETIIENRAKAIADKIGCQMYDDIINKFPRLRISSLK